jgi:hypothetical protein
MSGARGHLLMRLILWVGRVQMQNLMPCLSKNSIAHQKSFKTQATQVGNAQCVEKTIPVTMNL